MCSRAHTRGGASSVQYAELHARAKSIAAAFRYRRSNRRAPEAQLISRLITSKCFDSDYIASRDNTADYCRIPITIYYERACKCQTLSGEGGWLCEDSDKFYIIASSTVTIMNLAQNNLRRVRGPFDISFTRARCV